MIKNKTSRSIISILLVILIILSLTACGSNSSNQTNVDSQDPASTNSTTEDNNDSDTNSNASSDNADTETADENAPLGKYKEPVEITMVGSVDPTMNFDSGQTFEDNIWSELYKEKLNIEISYLWVVNQDQYDQKMTVAIASNELPDIIYFGMSDSNFKLLAENDQLQDLSQVYEDYASDFTKSIINDAGDIALESGTFDGKLFGIPNTNASIEQAQIVWYRQDWLDKLNLEAPTTMDELYELARKFIESGLGVEYAFGMTENLGDIAGFFAAHGAYLKKWIEVDGTIQYSSIQPEVKTALQALANLYKEGLLDKEFAVKDYATMSEGVNAGKAGIFWGGHASPLWPLISSFENDPSIDWTPHPLPSATGNPTVQVVDVPVQGYYGVTIGCEHPEALLKMMNLFTETCFSENMDAKYFITSEQYREPFKHARVQTWPIDKNIAIHQRIVKGLETNDMSIIEGHPETAAMYEFIQKFEETGVEGWDYTRVFGVGGSEGVMADYVENNQIIYNKFYGPPTPTMSTKLSTLQKQEDELFMKIIIGEASIDEFDKWVEQWKKSGGDDITKEVNDLYK